MAIISVEEARQLSRSTLIKSGMDNKEAEIITDILLEADMMNRPTHGFIRLPAIVGETNKQLDSSVKVVREDGNYALVDGGGKPGYVAAYYAMEFAIKKTEKHGLALVGVKNSGHSGMLGYYARMAIKRDFIGIASATPVLWWRHGAE